MSRAGESFPEPLPPPARPVWPRLLAVLLVGLVLPAVLLLLGPSSPYPLHQVRTELATLLTVFVLGSTITAVHTRRRQPALVPEALLWFACAFAVRVAFAIPLTDYAYEVRPYLGGYYSEDAHLQSVEARSYALLLTGHEHHLSSEPRVERHLADYFSGRVRRRENEWLYWPAISVLALPFILAFGYSVVAVNLVTSAIASFFVAQCLVYFSRTASSRTGRLVAAWLAFTPHTLYYSMGLLKDIPNGIGAIYMIEALGRPESFRTLRGWLSWLVLAYAMSVLRRFMYMLVAAAFVYGLLRQALPSVQQRLRFDLTLLGGALASTYGLVLAGHSRVVTSPLRFPIDFVLNVIYVPALSWYFTPGLDVEVERTLSFVAALVWPVFGGLMLVGAALYRTGRIPVASPALVLALSYIALTTLTALSTTTVRRRMTFEPFLIAFVLETLWYVRRLPARERRHWMMVAGGYAAAAYGLNFLYALLSVAR